MTREPRLDDRTVDWLCAGPERAPDWVLAAVDAHARSHPRGRLSRWLPGRTIMSNLRLVRSEEGAGAGRVSRAWAGAASFAAVVLVVGAFAVGALWNRNPAVVTGPPAASGDAASTEPVALSAVCTVGGTAVDTTSGGVTRTRGGWQTCTTMSTDARLVGSATVYLSVDRRDTGAGDVWGEMTIRTAKGRWSGPFSGSLEPDATQHLTGVLFGAGAYDGSRLMFAQTGTIESFALQGTIEPTTARATPGDVVVRRLTCLSGGDPGTESMDPSGINHVQGRSMTCTAEASDPRLGGELTLVAGIEAQPDESARIWGTESLLTPDGAWLGTWAGTYDAGWTTHRWTGAVTGSGAHAGLEYRFTTIGEWPRFVQVGELAGGG